MNLLADTRILHVLGGSAYGGGSKVILDLVEAALAEGARVDILTTNERMTTEARAIGAGVADLDLIHRPMHPLRDLQGLWGLVRFLKRERYDVVHTHTSKAGIIGRVAAKFTPESFVIHTVHGFAFHERSPRWLIAAVWVAERLGAALSDLVVTVSEHHYAAAKRLRIVPVRKLQAIPNGIRAAGATDAERVPAVRAELLADGGDTILLCHGRLARQKGIIHLINAISSMKANTTLPTGVRVIVAGDGPLRETLERQVAELGIGEVVRFLGFRSDIDDLLDASDVIVLPSLWEGLSIALMEAMARGCLVAVSDIPSNVELIEHNSNGILFPAADDEAIARVLGDVLARLTELRPLGAQAKLDVETNHSVERMRSAYLKAYADGLAGKVR